MEFRKFEPSLFEFLDELQVHNERRWFQDNKLRYESDVLEPSLAFIRAFQPRLRKISRFFVASDQRIGGSLMRVYRDTRFSKDKAPYKTNVGIQFRHELGKDVHAPGFYVHIAPDECFLGVGAWHPDPDSLARIREAIAEQPDRWRRASADKKFRQYFTLEGDCLRSVPRGYPADHKCAEDLKRKDFVGLRNLAEADVLSEEFLATVTDSFAASRLFLRFLCEALRVPF